MGLIATIHTTDIDQMAELVAAARSHGPIEVCYVAGGLELHRATGDQAEPEPEPAAPPAPAAKRAPAPKKTPAKPAPKATADTTCPDCGHVANSPNGVAIHRARRHGWVGPNSARNKKARGKTTPTPAAAEPATFTTDTPIGRGPIDHDAARTRAAQAI